MEFPISHKDDKINWILSNFDSYIRPLNKDRALKLLNWIGINCNLELYDIYENDIDYDDLNDEEFNCLGKIRFLKNFWNAIPLKLFINNLDAINYIKNNSLNYILTLSLEGVNVIFYNPESYDINILSFSIDIDGNIIISNEMIDKIIYFLNNDDEAKYINKHIIKLIDKEIVTASNIKEFNLIFGTFMYSSYHYHIALLEDINENLRNKFN